MEDKDLEVIGAPIIKYGDSTVLVQHSETGLWLTYKVKSIQYRLVTFSVHIQVKNHNFNNVKLLAATDFLFYVQFLLFFQLLTGARSSVSKESVCFTIDNGANIGSKNLECVIYLTARLAKHPYQPRELPINNNYIQNTSLLNIYTHFLVRYNWIVDKFTRIYKREIKHLGSVSFQVTVNSQDIKI